MLCATLLFLNLGGGEVFLIVLVIIMLFGSDKLPGIAKGISKGIREINDAKDQIQNEIQKSTSGLREEIEKHTSELQKEINKADEGIKQHMDEISKSVDNAVSSEETTKTIEQSVTEVKEEISGVQNTVMRQPPSFKHDLDK